MHLSKITEGSTQLFVPDLKVYKRKEDAPVFYNSVFTSDRDLSILIFKKYFKKALVADILCATGARGIRYANELKFDVVLNDASPSAIELVKKNAKLNKVKVKTNVGSANKFLLSSNKFNLIDIDPFGSPVKFIKDSLKKIKLRGILAISATDLGTLSGRYPKRCLERYGIEANKTIFSHELGIRNLIASVQIEAVKQKLNVEPIFAYVHEHYYKLYLKVSKFKKLNNLGYYMYCEKCGYRKAVSLFQGASLKCKCKNKLIYVGPTWVEKLGDSKFMKQIPHHFVNTEELDIKEPYYDLHKLAKLRKKMVTKTSTVIEKLNKKGYKACKTNLCRHGIKTNAPFDVLEDSL